MSEKFNPIDKVWTEKYRPTKVDNVIGDFKEKVKKYLKNPNNMPHFLFYSKTPGTGKSTLCKAIINELGCDPLILNSSDDRKLEVIREKIKGFISTKSSKEGMRRAVMCDEADGLLNQSQQALRSMLEQYQSNAFFMFTCNNINKIIDPIKSRCVVIPFAYPEKEAVATHLKWICEQENLQYNNEGITEVIDANYPSIRNCVIALQDLHTQGLAVTKENVKPINDMFEDMWKKLQLKDWKTIKTEILESTIDPRELNTYFWKKALELEQTPLKLIQVTCRNERDIAMGADPKVIFVTSIIEMCK